MPWDYFPLTTGSQISIETVVQELVEAINERCVWAGIAELTDPVTGDTWFTASNIKQIQQKIEDIVPYFVDPTANISGTVVTFNLLDWDSLLASMPAYFDTNNWNAITKLQQLEYRQATGGDKASMNKLGSDFSFWRQMYEIVDRLRYKEESVTWATDNQDWRWMSSRPSRNFIPPIDTTGGLVEADAKTYVQDHWASGAWWDRSSGIPPVPNSTNGAYMGLNVMPFYQFDNFLRWGQARWIRNSSGITGPIMIAYPVPYEAQPLPGPVGPLDCEIEIMRSRNNLTSLTVVSGSAIRIYGYQIPHVHGADFSRGDLNEATTTGTAAQILITENHTSGTVLASGLGYDDSTPTPTPNLADICGGCSARQDETYYILSPKILIEINFAKLS